MSVEAQNADETSVNPERANERQVNQHPANRIALLQSCDTEAGSLFVRTVTRTH